MIDFSNKYKSGRGAQFNTHNRFHRQSLSKDITEGIDDWDDPNPKTVFIDTHPKTIVNKVESPDIGIMYSLNPYQGCEHGCIYCYARNSHQYWDFSAGLDFEQKILIKKEAPILFKNFIERKNWDASIISLSGNTDCYQPAERKFKLTRQILEIAAIYKQPVSIITKNSLILRDTDVLTLLAKDKLVMVYVSITCLDEKLRQKLEPRTTTAKQRLKVVEELRKIGVPVGVMTAPIIPGLNDYEIPNLLKTAATHGALNANYTIVRLNGDVHQLFEDWLQKNFPDRFNKVWHMIQSCHNGQVSDHRFGQRIKGEGNIAKIINDNFRLHCQLNHLNQTPIELNRSLFKVPKTQMSLF